VRLDESEYEESFLLHYGIKRKSGRYPWGSGETPQQRSKTFLQITEELRAQGMSDSAIAKAFSDEDHKLTTSNIRALRSISTNIQTEERIRTAQSLKDKGMGNSAIARQMDLNESTVRSLLAPGRQEKLDILQSTADMLKRQVEEKEFLDVGANVERDLPIGDNPATRIGISSDKFKTSLAILEEEGYNVHRVPVKQVGTGETTNYLVLTKPGVTQKEAWQNRDKIRPLTEKSDDGGRTYDGGLKPPLNIDPKRVGIRYKEDGGDQADGVVFVRPGVPDVSLGKSHYAQVRIAVGGTHYLKGMAVYKDDLPKGVDLQFNTNKSDTGNKMDALKPQKTDDPTNPFGAAIKAGGQQLKDGKPISVMNIVNEEGDWDKWSKTISSQVLSKQTPDLATKQLAWTFDKRQQEYNKIKELTNPQIRKTLLKTFSDETDSAAVHLKAASMPGQATKVLLPSNHVKPTEIFAPTFADGTRVALLRYPHAGTFEIPDLVVNNRGREAKKLLGLGKGETARDAVLIHPDVAARMSGADFDGDSVVVIPNNRGDIRSSHPLDGLRGFDPQRYKVKTPEEDPTNGRVTITSSRKGLEMGNVTNLISDMTIKGANTEELARAVRHSMVVIDSEKHNLDFKASERDNGIADLKRRYQGVGPRGNLRGASTLVTRSTAQTYVPNRKAAPSGGDIVGGIDRRTGRKVYVKTGEHSVRFKDAEGRQQSKSFRTKEEAEAFVRDHAPNGKIAVKRTRSQQLAETDDAFTLVSEHGGMPIERVYAEHSNRLKAMANDARREMVNTELIPYSPSAKKTYASQVQSLDAKLNIALMNAPVERHAQSVANHIVAQQKRANPEMDAETERKLRGRALNEARARTGAGKTRIQIEQDEWDAIQAGAISNHRLTEILKNADLDQVRKLATPRAKPVMTPRLASRAKTLLASGYTLKEVADDLGVPLSTLKSSVYGEES
jgi:hypothetical protein